MISRQDQDLLNGVVSFVRKELIPIATQQQIEGINEFSKAVELWTKNPLVDFEENVEIGVLQEKGDSQSSETRGVSVRVNDNVIQFGAFLKVHSKEEPSWYIPNKLTELTKTHGLTRYKVDEWYEIFKEILESGSTKVSVSRDHL